MYYHARIVNNKLEVEVKKIKDILEHVKIINSMGGVSAVAKRFGFSKQRVHNWLRLGIPPQIYLDNQKLFNRYKNKANKPPKIKEL